MTTENVIRALSAFRKEKIIRIIGCEIEIMDMESLDRILEERSRQLPAQQKFLLWRDN